MCIYEDRPTQILKNEAIPQEFRKALKYCISARLVNVESDGIERKEFTLRLKFTGAWHETAVTFRQLLNEIAFRLWSSHQLNAPHVTSILYEWVGDHGITPEYVFYVTFKWS